MSYYNSTTCASSNATSVQITIDFNLSTPEAKQSLSFECRLPTTPTKGNDADARVTSVVGGLWEPRVKLPYLPLRWQSLGCF